MRKKRRSNKNYKQGIILASITMIFLAGMIVIKGGDENQKQNIVIEGEKEKDKEEKSKEEVKKESTKKEIIISAAGDCTLGTDPKFNQSTSFNAEVRNSGNDYSSIMKNVYDIFSKDDYTIANLETTFTEAKEKANKGGGVNFHFKGPKEYVNILKEGSIEGVTIANNHIYDYGKQGFEDTVNTLKEASVDIAGEGYKILKDIKGIKFAFLGYQGWSNTEDLRNKITADIEEVKNQGAIVIVPYFHWGLEGNKIPYDVQVSLAKHSIDAGASMVLGSHPHVMQSIEEYKGKMIVYSLGNFSFGGNSNPSDKRTFILQVKFNFEDEELKKMEYKVIPTSITSTGGRNDYRPTPYKGEVKNKVLQDINEISKSLKGKITDEFFEIVN